MIPLTPRAIFLIHQYEQCKIPITKRQVMITSTDLANTTFKCRFRIEAFTTNVAFKQHANYAHKEEFPIAFNRRDVKQQKLQVHKVFPTPR